MCSRYGNARGEVASPTTDLPHGVERVGHGEDVDADHVPGHVQGGGLGFLPGTLLLQHLRAVDPTDAREQ